jgi:hypothetical protein
LYSVNQLGPPIPSTTNAQSLYNLRIRFKQAAIEVFRDGAHTRARELGDVFAVGEIVVRIAGRRERKADKPREANDKGEHGGRDAHAQRIQPPQCSNNWNHQCGNHHYGPRQTWKDGQEECNRIRVDDHEVDKVDRREQDRLLESGKKDQGYDHRQRKRRGRRRPSQHHDPEQVEQDPGQTEGNRRSEAVLAPCHQCKRDEMNENRESQQRKAMTICG